MKTKMKLARLRYFLLTLVMVVGMLPATSLTVSAATGTGTEADPYIVTDYDELRDLMMNTPDNTTRYIKLGSDISYSESTNDHSLTLTNSLQSVVLDLNGYTISRSGKTTDTGVVSLTGGKLTIRDSSTGTGKITSSVTAGEEQATLCVHSGRLIIEGGTFEVNAGRYAEAIYTLGGITEIYGGTFINNTWTGEAACFYYGTVCVDGGTFIMNSDDSESDGLYIYFGNPYKVYLYNCTVIGGRLVLNDTAIPDGCSRSDTTIDGKPAVVIKAEDGVGVVKSLSATVENPLEGATPATVAFAGDSRYKATIEKWYQGGTAENPGFAISTDHTFVGGETYVVRVRFTPKSGEFFRSDISAAINGAEGYCCGIGADGTLMFRVAFKVPADIKEVVMTSDTSTPAIGWAATTPTFNVTEGNPVETRNATWQKYDDTTSTWNDYSGTTFEEGKYRCRVTLWLKTADIENYLMSSDVTATVNGVSWEVDNKITWDGTNRLVRCTAYSPEYTAVKKYKVSFDANGGTGTMEDDIVFSGKASRYYQLPENGFTAPEGKYFKGWGKTPDASTVISPSNVCPIFADTTFYAIWGDITYIDTVDVTIPAPVPGESPQNGVSNTEGVSVSITEWSHNGVKMSSSDSFVAGETYKVHVIVNPDGQNLFAENPTVTFNGSKKGTVYLNSENYINYYAEFTAVEPTIIDAVDVKITMPVAGAHPKDAVSNTEHVSASEILWVRLNGGGFLSETDTFVEGDPYRASVMVTADNGYVFAEDATVTINGSTKGTVALINNDSLYFYVDFTAELSARDKITNFVTRMYQQCLSREPDEAGLAGWVEQLESGQMNGAQIAEAFVFSNEMLNKNLSHEEFVKVLYRAMMGREADADGLAGWMKELTNDYSSRSEVTKAFVESAEFTAICESYGIIRGDYVAVGDIERFVAGFYTKCLGRPADAAGHWGWVKQLQQKNLNGAQIAEAFFFSEEFVNKNVSDEVYIATLYRTILGREADAAGLAGWVEQLQSSQMTRRDVLGAFIESTEFTGLCAGYGIERGSL